MSQTGFGGGTQANGIWIWWYRGTRGLREVGVLVDVDLVSLSLWSLSVGKILKVLEEKMAVPAVPCGATPTIQYCHGIYQVAGALLFVFHNGMYFFLGHPGQATRVLFLVK